MKENKNQFVEWFRKASPYIHAHRESTFVFAFGGEATLDPGFASMVHDIALLQSLGIRLVLVHGDRPQIEERLKLRGAKMQLVNGLRVTDAAALACVKEAAGSVRVEIEALLSMGVANSPMSGANIQVASGNYVTAKPLGVLDGIDYGHTGEVRKINTKAIMQNLDNGELVLVSPLGYSLTGEIFNLNAADVAASVATAIGADKLVFLTEEPIRDGKRQLISSMVPTEVDQLINRRKALPEQQQRVLGNAAKACRGGVSRVHILPRKVDGVLLTELFTRDGAGTLIMAAAYESLRAATISDVGGILELIEPLEANGVMVKRSRELLETEIDRFTVVERDGAIIACAALYPYQKQGMAELACVAVHPDYRDQGKGDQLLLHMEQQAAEIGISQLFVLTTRTAQWFRDRGFEPAPVTTLPGKRRDLYNWQRNSRLLIKPIDC